MCLLNTTLQAGIYQKRLESESEVHKISYLLLHVIDLYHSVSFQISLPFCYKFIHYVANLLLISGSSTTTSLSSVPANMTSSELSVPELMLIGSQSPTEFFFRNLSSSLLSLLMQMTSADWTKIYNVCMNWSLYIYRTYAMHILCLFCEISILKNAVCSEIRILYSKSFN